MIFSLENKGFGVVKNKKNFLVFLKYEKTFLDYGIRDHMEHSSQITSTKKDRSTHQCKR